MMLPIAKEEVVKGRIGATVCQQFLQIILMTPFIFLSAKLSTQGNQAGMNPNIALIGLAFITYGISNIIFFTKYYKNVNKVGIAFFKACMAIVLILFFWG